jgi:hypothetical protein
MGTNDNSDRSVCLACVVADSGDAMIYSIDHSCGLAYVTRQPTRAECLRYIGNGYNPPDAEREANPDVYRYIRGETKPNYPMPATLKNAGVATTHEDAAICLRSLGMVAFLMVYDDAKL